MLAKFYPGAQTHIIFSLVTRLLFKDSVTVSFEVSVEVSVEDISVSDFRLNRVQLVSFLKNGTLRKRQQPDPMEP